MLILSPCFRFAGDEILGASPHGELGRDCRVGFSLAEGVYEQLRCYGLNSESGLCGGYLTHLFFSLVFYSSEIVHQIPKMRSWMYHYVSDVDVWFGEFQSDDDAYGCQDIHLDYEYDDWGNVVAACVDPPVDLSEGWYISSEYGQVFVLSVVADYDPLSVYDDRYVRGCYVGACVGRESVWLTMQAYNYGVFTLSMLSDPEYVYGSGSDVMRLVSGFAELF